jgi:hypothetical protein
MDETGDSIALTERKTKGYDRGDKGYDEGYDAAEQALKTSVVRLNRGHPQLDPLVSIENPGV